METFERLDHALCQHVLLHHEHLFQKAIEDMDKDVSYHDTHPLKPNGDNHGSCVLYHVSKMMIGALSSCRNADVIHFFLQKDNVREVFEVSIIQSYDETLNLDFQS